jgi:hypothetical protein
MYAVCGVFCLHVIQNLFIIILGTQNIYLRSNFFIVALIPKLYGQFTEE